MNEVQKFTTLLKNYLEYSQEPMAAELRQHFKITSLNLNSLSDEQIQDLANNAFMEDWISIQNVSRKMNISAHSLQVLCDGKKIPCSRIGGQIYFKTSDLISLINKNYNGEK